MSQLLILISLSSFNIYAVLLSCVKRKGVSHFFLFKKGAKIIFLWERLDSN